MPPMAALLASGVPSAWSCPRRTSRCSPRSSAASSARWPSSGRRAGGHPSTAGPRPGTGGRTPTTPGARRRSSEWCWPPAGWACPDEGPGDGVAMDTTRDDNNEELGRIARQLFEARCPLTTVRQLEGDPLGYLPGLWREMAGLDWLSLTYPEALGGAGGTMVDLSVIYQELGRAVVPSPHLASAVIAGET